MEIFDAHCDTLSSGDELFKNSRHFDIERALKRGGGRQVMAAFGKNQTGQLARLAALPERFLSSSGTEMRLIPAVEGADTITSMEELERFISLGVRMIGLTWNHDNALAGGCSGENGITETGRDILTAMEIRGCVPDLAHASKRTFWDCMETVAGPVIVSHTLCSAVHSHKRNLDDDQLRALGDRGGVAGMTLYTRFVNGREDCSVNELIAHIVHAVNIAGEDAIGIGSDFDGCEQLPDEIGGTQDLPALIERLPFSGRVKDKIAYCNFCRIIV